MGDSEQESQEVNDRNGIFVFENDSFFAKCSEGEEGGHSKEDGYKGH